MDLCVIELDSERINSNQDVYNSVGRSMHQELGDKENRFRLMERFFSPPSFKESFKGVTKFASPQLEETSEIG